jgi:hypothetical protein
MMKAIWRHIRLKKEFQNFEQSPYGGMKLRIPVELFNEKIRTQSRFHVSESRQGKAEPVEEVKPCPACNFLSFCPA